MGSSPTGPSRSLDLKRDPKFTRDTHPELPLDPDAVRPGAYRWPLHITPFLLAVVFVGGCLGTLSRYGIGLALTNSDGSWPVATFMVNLIGAFVLGLLLEALAKRGPDEGDRRIVRLGVGTGFLGAFTTYSALAVDTDLLMRSSKPGLAVLYLGLSVLGGLIFAAIGIQTAAFHRKRRKGGDS